MACLHSFGVVRLQWWHSKYTWAYTVTTVIISCFESAFKTTTKNGSSCIRDNKKDEGLIGQSPTSHRPEHDSKSLITKQFLALDCDWLSCAWCCCKTLAVGLVLKLMRETKELEKKPQRGDDAHHDRVKSLSKLSIVSLCCSATIPLDVTEELHCWNYYLLSIKKKWLVINLSILSCCFFYETLPGIFSKCIVTVRCETY